MFKRQMFESQNYISIFFYGFFVGVNWMNGYIEV